LSQEAAMQTFTIRDLRDRTGDLVRDAEAGKLSIVTKHGQPVFLAVPFDEALVQEGLRVSLAVKLFDDEVISVRQGAKMAGMTLSEFMTECSARNVPVVRYSPGELEQELATLDALPDRG
jgi:prevent-host-death family protein